MKICRFVALKDPWKKGRLGLVLEKEGVVVDCNMVWVLDFQRAGRYNPRERANYCMPPSLHDLLRLRDDPLEDLQQCHGLYFFYQKIGNMETVEGVPIALPLSEAILLNPLDRITSYRDFYAHEKHVATSFKKRGGTIPDTWYKMPVYYKGATAGFIGPGEEILWPSYTEKLDYELELALVIGREGRNIPGEEAMEYVLGFTILNDISARDIQREEMEVRLGPAKGKDFCSVLGPVITTMDEFNFEEPNLLMKAYINGELWSEGRSGEAHYSWAKMMAHLSRDEWVLPGDVLASGTVGTGCGMELDRWISPGDTVELEVENIGKLTNPVGKKKNGKL